MLETLIERVKRLDLYDRVDLESHVYHGVIDYVVHTRAKTIDSILSAVKPLCETAYYLGRVCIACGLLEKVAEHAEEYGLSLSEYRAVVKRIAETLDILFNDAEQRYISVISETITRDSVLLLLSPNSRMLRLATAIGFKLEKVLIPTRDPIKSGIGLAKALRKRNVNAYYVPDDSLAWAVLESNIVIADAFGIGPGDRLIVDAGVEPAIALSRGRNTRPLILLPTPSACERRTSEEAEAPSVVVESSLGGPRVRLSLVDLLDPGKYKFEIVTENAVLEASRQVVRERVRVVQEDIVDDTIQSVLDAML